MSEIILTDANFDQEVLKSSVPVFVDFWAPWCGPCQKMGPIVEALSEEYGSDKIKVGKLNVDENQQVAGKYKVLSIPTFMIFKNGQVADQTIGGVSRETLKEMIDRNI